MKCGPIPVLDEIGLVAGTLLRFKYPIRVHINIYTLTLFYFALIYLAGFLLHHNINTLRYVAIGLLLIVYGELKASYLTRKSILFAAVIYLLFSIFIPLYGLLYGLDVAWWQNGVWTGTAYSSIGIFVSAITIVLLSLNNSYGIMAIAMMYAIGTLTDSRFTILLLCIVVATYLIKIAHDMTISRVIKRIVALALLTVFCLILIFNIPGIKDIDLYNIQLSQLKSISSTILSVVSDDATRDEDRKDNNSAVLSLTTIEPFSAVMGSGGLSHQKDMANYVRASLDGRVRPVGFPAIVFDGGWIFFLLITACSIKTSFITYKKYNYAPLFLKLGVMSFPAVAFLSIFITNSLDAVLFWLMISPVGLPSFLVESWYCQPPHA